MILKINVPTVHNEARLGDIAKTVIMPGDPLRAKYIVENFFDEYTCYNNVRGMLGYTGNYKGVRLSVQGSGMGIPSMGIYSKELFEGYDVDNIIRVGSAGSLSNDRASKYAKDVKLGDILVARDVDTDSNFGISSGYEELYPIASEKLLNILLKIKDNVKVGTIFTSDVFYKDKEKLIEVSQSDVMGVEMETYALYLNALSAGKNALAIFTVSDNPILGEFIDSEKREKGLNEMIEIALELAIKCEKEEMI
ncbi:MAG: purine-nucleoside phosphorylase [Clostridia bacterium]|nr:purine-nucleoside phosphorylase [Clostridia bacterium]